jgi:apurinic endonuclease APN1
MSIEAMVDELQRCEALDVAGLVFHPGAHCEGEVRDPYEVQIQSSKVKVQKRRQRGNKATRQAGTKGNADRRNDEVPALTPTLSPGERGMGAHMRDGIERIAQGMDEVHSRCAGFRTKLLLECTAGQGSAIGWQFEQLAEILKRVREPARVGVCLDTCHLFAAGYDFRTPETYAAMIDRLDRTIGVSRVKCIHCNDSKRELGSRVDRHEHIGKGLIGKSGFAHFLNDPRFCEVPFILETPKEKDEKGRDMDVVNVKKLRSLIA